MRAGTSNFRARAPDAPQQRWKFKPDPLKETVKAGERPEVEVMTVMAEFYLLEMMRAEEAPKMQSEGFRLRHPIAYWLKHVDLKARQESLLDKEAPRVFELITHLLAEELTYPERDPVHPGEVPEAGRTTTRERLWCKAGHQQLLPELRGLGMDGRDFAQFAERIFGDRVHWHKEFGGEAWAQIARGLERYSPYQQGVWLDQIFHLQHNNGLLFEEKEGTGYKRPFHEDQTRVLLDFKFQECDPSTFLALIEGMEIPVSSDLRRWVKQGANIGLWPQANLQHPAFDRLYAARLRWWGNKYTPEQRRWWEAVTPKLPRAKAAARDILAGKAGALQRLVRIYEELNDEGQFEPERSVVPTGEARSATVAARLAKGVLEATAEFESLPPELRSQDFRQAARQRFEYFRAYGEFAREAREELAAGHLANTVVRGEPFPTRYKRILKELHRRDPEFDIDWLKHAPDTLSPEVAGQLSKAAGDILADPTAPAFRILNAFDEQAKRAAAAEQLARCSATVRGVRSGKREVAPFLNNLAATFAILDPRRRAPDPWFDPTATDFNLFPKRLVTAVCDALEDVSDFAAAVGRLKALYPSLRTACALARLLTAVPKDSPAPTSGLDVPLRHLEKECRPEKGPLSPPELFEDHPLTPDEAATLKKGIWEATARFESSDFLEDARLAFWKDVTDVCRLFRQSPVEWL